MINFNADTVFFVTVSDYEKWVNEHFDTSCYSIKNEIMWNGTDLRFDVFRSNVQNRIQSISESVAEYFAKPRPNTKTDMIDYILWYGCFVGEVPDGIYIITHNKK